MKKLMLFMFGFVTINLSDEKRKWGEEYTEWYICPNCEEQEISKFYQYCPMCGKRVHWVD